MGKNIEKTIIKDKERIIGLLEKENAELKKKCETLESNRIHNEADIRQYQLEERERRKYAEERCDLCKYRHHYRQKNDTRQ